MKITVMRNIAIILALIALMGCSKDDPSLFLWEKTIGTGVAYHAEVADDSLFMISGVSNGSPLFIRSVKGNDPDINYTEEVSGMYTSFTWDTAGFYLAGSTEGSMLITGLTPDGEASWTLSVDGSDDILISTTKKYDDESFIAIGSDHPDSVNFSTVMILFYDKNGNILEQNEVSPGNNLSVSDMVIMPTGEIAIALTKRYPGGKSKASVAGITPEGNILWETELYNNSNFGAASLAIDADSDGIIYVTGRTELTVETGLLYNSFISCLTSAGSVIWKEYLESSNSGEDILFENSSSLVMLNKNCFILDFISLPDGALTDLMRVYEACDSYDTGNLGYAFDITGDASFLLAGSKSGKFYYALRSGRETLTRK
ncbi:MAG: hypothetical protein K8R35_04330 [Bacteroidales bacterium]|nr:hypothetical protein [Bacteroidales bacterium]